MVLGLWDFLFCVSLGSGRRLHGERVGRLTAAINRLLETYFPALFHTASALSAPSGHLPLEGKAIYIKWRSHHHKFESRRE